MNADAEWYAICADCKTTNAEATNIDGKVLHLEINLHKLIEISKSNQ